MGFLKNLKANQAYREHAKGNVEAAKAGYEQAFAEGMDNAKFLLAYAMLLLRDEQYEKAIEVLRKAEKAPGITVEQKNQVVAHYAVAIWKLGKVDRSVELLKDVFRRGKNGFLYSILGFLLIEQGNAEEALAFNQEAVDYDEDDAVCIDNLAQTYYRLMNDRETAKGYFEQALKRKPGAIDTNYFLAQYDVEEGHIDAAIEKLETASQGRFSPLNHASKDQILAQIEALRQGAKA